MHADRAPSAETCSTHEYQKLDAYCRTCTAPVCTKSTADEHQDHWHQSLVDAFREAETALDDIIAKAMGYIRKRRDELSETCQTREHVQSSFKMLKDGIQLTAGQMRDIINIYENQMLSKLEHHEKGVLAKLESVEQQLEKQKSSALSLKEEAEHMRHPHKARDTVQRSLALQKQFEEIRRKREEYVTWKADIGKIHQTEKTLRALLGGIDLKTSVKKSPGRKALGTPVDRLNLNSVNRVKGMAVIGNCLAMMLEGEDLCLSNIEMGYLTKCPDLDIQYASDMALLKPAGRTVVIAAPKQLLFVQISADLDVTVLRKKAVEISNPSSISVSMSTGNLVIGDRKPCIYVCNEEGDVQNSIGVADYLLCVKQTVDGFAVLKKDRYRQFISWVDKEGNQIHQYHTEKKDVVTTSTNQIVQDGEGNLIFAEKDNHRIDVVTPNGRFAQHLLTRDDGIQNPEYVYLDEEASKLYVVHQPSEFKEVLVYRWSKCGDSYTTSYKLEAHVGKFQ